MAYRKRALRYTSADVIVVMEQGRIVAQGKHEQLMADNPIYASLYERQVMGVSA